MMFPHSLYQNIFHLLTVIPIFLMIISFHEFAHGIVATYFGDPTPRDANRLTLNPFAHINFLGLFCLIVFHFGWATPVPFNSDYFKHRRLYTVITALAGPFANFLLALIGLYIGIYSQKIGLSGLELSWLLYFLKLFIDINIVLGVFNLIPIPPLDGGHLLQALAPDPDATWIQVLEEYGFFILLILFFIPSFNQKFGWFVATTKVFLMQLVI